MKKYSIVISARYIFDSLNDCTFQGGVCITGNKIVKIIRGEVPREILDAAEQVYVFEEEMVMPGIVDTHTFFTGYAVFHLGANFSEVKDNLEAFDILRKEYESRRESQVIFGHGWNPENWKKEEGEALLESEFPNTPVILFSADRSNCLMNQKAKDIYQFTGDSCYPESYYRIMREYLNDREFINKAFSRYMEMLNSRGVTTVKEMGFDDFYGFTNFLKEIENSPDLNIRFFFMSQPVGEKMNLEFARKMKKTFTGGKIRFSGFNRMTDGTIANYCGDLKLPYENENFTCKISVPYEQIEKDVLQADAEGFRWSLHAQGDGAVKKIADIYEKCQLENGKLKNHHAITDLEFSCPKDLERLGRIGAYGEIYFQIMSLDSGDVILKNIQRTIGKERGKYYWNRRKMLEEGMHLSGATDLPLMITSIPDSIYYSKGGYLDGLEEPFQIQNTISAAEILKAWTIGGQKNLGMEEVLGTLQEGKIADIAVFNRNLLDEDLKKVRGAKTIMTIMDGKITYMRG